MDKPYILDENENFAVVFKPAKMHSAAKNNIYRKGTEGAEEKDCEQQENGKKEQINIFEWYASKTNAVYDIMHRLDYETHGLVLLAKNEKSFLFFKEAQQKGEFIKEYSAICAQENKIKMEGFPEYNSSYPCIIESYFRPYGHGRKLVRPVIIDGKKHKEIAKDKGGFYRTEIVEKCGNAFTVRIKRGFRHQIRCHLCWIGFPILNDPLYSRSENNDAVSPDSVMALRSHALFFPEPESGEKREYSIEKIINL